MICVSLNCHSRLNSVALFGKYVILWRSQDDDESVESLPRPVERERDVAENHGWVDQNDTPPELLVLQPLLLRLDHGQACNTKK